MARPGMLGAHSNACSRSCVPSRASVLAARWLCLRPASCGARCTVDTHLRGQSRWLVNYAKRSRAGLWVRDIDTAGRANFRHRRMNKAQQMRWSRRGADLMLQVRCAVYNGVLGPGFGNYSRQHPLRSSKHHWPLDPPNSGHPRSKPTPVGTPDRPGEFHPDPNVTLSRHPPRVIERRPPPFPPRIWAHPVASWPAPTSMTCSLCSAGITPRHHYYGAVRP
jgi:hypothetical protein